MAPEEATTIVLIDLSEPQEIENLLKQSVPVTRMSLNQNRKSDYYFGGADNKTRQWSRKQAGELLSDLDEAERQLRSYYNQADENNQIVEGIISPVPLRFLTDKQVAMMQGGKLKISQLKVIPKSKVYGKARHVEEGISTRHFARTDGLYSYSVGLALDGSGVIGFVKNEQYHRTTSGMLNAWIYQLTQVGIVTYFTVTEADTAKLIAAAYNSCQKPEHTTLQRYIRPRVYIKEYDHHVLTLMGLDKAQLGETRAKALITRFGTAFDVFVAEYEDVCAVPGMGRITTEKLFDSIGRTA